MIFISHSSKDKEQAKRLALLLKSNGFSYWIDHEQIFYGEDIITKIQDGLSKSNVLIFLISENSNVSPWCRKEYQSILYDEINKEEKLVIPVLIDNSEIPPLLKSKKNEKFSELLINQQKLNELLRQLGRYTKKEKILQDNKTDIVDIIRDVTLLLIMDRFPNGVWGRSLAESAASYGHGEDPGSITISLWTIDVLFKLNNLYFDSFQSDFKNYVLDHRKENGGIGMKKNIGSDFAPKIKIIENNRHTAIASIFLHKYGASENLAYQSIIRVINQRTDTWAWSAMEENLDENADPLTTGYILSSIKYFENIGVLSNLNFNESKIFLKKYWDNGLTWLYQNLSRNNNWWQYSTLKTPNPSAKKRKYCYTVDILYHLVLHYNNEDLLDEIIEILLPQLLDIWEKYDLGIPLGEEGKPDLTTTAQFSAICWLLRNKYPDYARKTRAKFYKNIRGLLDENKSDSAGWSILLEYFALTMNIQFDFSELSELTEKASFIIDDVFNQNKSINGIIQELNNEFLKMNIKRQLETLNIIAP